MRGRVGYENNPLFTELSYLWFESYAHPQVANVFQASTGSDPVSVGVSLGFRYQNVDWKLGHQLCLSTFSQVSFFANARWVDIAQDLHYKIVDQTVATINTARNRSCFQGGALGVGVGYQTPLCRCLKLVGMFNPMIVMGQKNPGDVRLIHIQATAPTFQASDALQPARFSIFPACNLQLALAFEWNYKCAKTLWTVGYELDYYWSVSDFNPVDPLAEDRALGFGGPFLSGKLLF